MTVRLVANNIGTMQNEYVLGFNPSVLNTGEGIQYVTDWAQEILSNSPSNTWSEFVLTDNDRQKIIKFNLFRYYEEIQEVEYQGEDELYKKREQCKESKLCTEMVMRIKTILG